jgi:general secretion pathway protein L
MTMPGILGAIWARALRLRSPLSSFIDIVRRVLFFSLAEDLIAHRKVVGLSLADDSFSIAVGRRIFSSVKISHARGYISETGSFPTPETVASTVSLEKGPLKFGRASVCLALPKPWTTVSISEFPASIKENAADAIRFEIDRITPFSPVDALYDFKILGESGGKLSVLVVAARADLIMPYINALKEKGIVVSCVTTHLTAAAALYAHALEETDFITVNEGAEAYEGAGYHAGFPSDIFSISSEKGAEALEQYLSDRIGLQEENSAGQPGRLSIMVTSEGDTAALVEILKRHEGTAIITAEEAVKRAYPKLSEDGHRAAAVGCLLEHVSAGNRGLNLLSRGIRPLKRTPLLLSTILIIAIIAAGIAYTYAPLSLERKKTTAIDAQIKAKKDEVRKVEALRKEIGVVTDELASIAAFREKRIPALNVIKEITTRLPTNAWLTRLRISETAIELDGYAGSATELLPKFESSKYFSKVELTSTIFRDKRLNADRFSIKMEFQEMKKENQATEVRNEKK